MRRLIPKQARWVGAIVAGAALVSAGGAGPTKHKEKPVKIDETIGDIASIIGNDYKVEGVGLVIGLDGTGSDPAPSWQRTKLINEMQKASVPHPEKFLRTKDVTMVTVRAVVPAGVTKVDKFDIEIELAPGSATTSLSGGMLLTTQLAQRARTPQGDKEDKAIATAGGPVMIGNLTKPGDPKVGRVLGGGRVKEESLYALSIRENRRSGKTSKLIMDTINGRFHQSEGADQKGMAVAKTDALLELRVPRTYHHNQDRYHKLVKLMPLVDSAELREERLVRWGKELQDPMKVGVAALKLEGMGPAASPTLRTALSSPDDTVKFFAAESLAYLNDSEGENAKVLADIARRKLEYRSFALKAMGATDNSASLLKLRGLMAESDFELRYGAFDALRTLDPTDPFLGKVQVLDDPPGPDPDDMAIQITSTVRHPKKSRAEEPFALYLVDCEGPPMVHVTRNIRSEVVVFGKDQQMLTPIVLGSGGSLLLNAADGDKEVQISKITAKILDAPRIRVASPLDVAEVIRQLASVGATYPDVVNLLAAASNQKNLPGPFVVDAIPLPMPAYDEAQLSGAVIRKDSDLKKTNHSGSRNSILERVQKAFGR